MNAMTDTTELASDLAEIHEQMTELLHQAERLLRGAPDLTYRRAHGYWLAQITMALSNDHDYLGRATVTMQDTIRELENDRLVE
jgi:hypothetical protein